MFKNLAQLYSIIICLVTALMLMVISGLVIQNITDLIFTEYTQKPRLANFNSPQEFIDSKGAEEAQEIKLLSPADLEKKIKLEKERYIQKIHDNAISSLITQAIWIIISLIFLISHWLIYKKSS